MRIVSGRWKGKALVAPDGEATRPTADRARQAIFNVLEHAPWSQGVLGTKVLDLFAGTGALGLEALSRGADFCLFIDQAPAARAALMGNVEACAAQGMSRIWKRDAGDLGPLPPSANGPFDLVFIDPPYGKGLERAALSSLTQGWLATRACVIVERGRGETTLDPAHIDPRYRLHDSRTYGAADILMIEWTG